MTSAALAWTERNGRLVLVTVILAAMLHIVATLAAPRMAGGTPFTRLEAITPLHKFALLPPIAPGNQPIAFMAPDFRYAMCRYDTGKGPVSVSARLPGRGWALALYTPQGDNFYTALGQDGQATDITLQLAPVADRFLGLTPEAQGLASEAVAGLTIATGKGLIVVRAPDRGIAYRAEAEAVLLKARCSQKPF